MAYANFSIDSLADAQYYFSALLNSESKYTTAAQYYSAYIAYVNGLYKTSLYGFKKLITDEHSGRILVDKDLAEEEEKKMESIFNSI